MTVRKVDGVTVDADTLDGDQLATVEATMDTKIGTHKDLPSAHHAKPTSLTELAVAGEVDGGGDVLKNMTKYTGDGVFAASDDLLKADDAEVSHSTSVYTLVKTITVPATVLSSILRIKFDLKSSDAGSNELGKVYKNGAPIGTERENNTVDWITFSEDLNTIVAGDTIELWLRRDVADTAIAQNFRLYGLWIPGEEELVKDTPASPTWA